MEDIWKCQKKILHNCGCTILEGLDIDQVKDAFLKSQSK